MLALTIGLMLSDYMSRQVLNAVFPALKAVWNLSDAQLGSFNSVVALIMSIFPAHMRSSLTAGFMAGAAPGSVIGMAQGGIITAHLGWRWAFGVMAAFGLVLVVLYRAIVTEAQLAVAFRVPVGTLQLVLIAAGMFVVSGTNGPSGAMVANVTPAAIHASVFATLTLANSLLGMAPGPFVTGLVAGRIGLHGALEVLPCVTLVSILAFAPGRRHYAGDFERARRAQA